MTAQERTDTSQQFSSVEGLGQIIVRTGVKSIDPVLHLTHRGQHDDRHLAAGSPGFPNHFVAIHTWHHDIHDAGIIISACQVSQGVISIRNRIHAVVAACQKRSDRTRNIWIILGKQ